MRNRRIIAREALPAELHAQLSRKMERHLGELLDSLNPAVLAFCWPFRAEFDARALVSGRLHGGLRACLPVVMDNDSPLEFREWTPQSEMIEDRYSIHIPARGEALRPDAILMPLNGFDEAGYRLGYGGGYFDPPASRTPAARHRRRLRLTRFKHPAAALTCRWRARHRGGRVRQRADGFSREHPVGRVLFHPKSITEILQKRKAALIAAALIPTSTRP